MHKLLAFILVLLPFHCVLSGERNNFDAKVAVIDIEAIFEHSVAVKKLKNHITQISQQIQNDLTQQEIELKINESELIKQRPNITQKEFDIKLFAFNKKVAQAQQDVQRKKIALEQAHSDAVSIVHQNTMEIIKKQAEQLNFNLVIPSSQILFVKNHLNITEQVIKELNETLKSVNLKYKA